MPAIQQGQTFMNGVMQGSEFISRRNQRTKDSQRRDDALQAQKDERLHQRTRETALDTRNVEQDKLRADERTHLRGRELALDTRNAQQSQLQADRFKEQQAQWDDGQLKRAQDVEIGAQNLKNAQWTQEQNVLNVQRSDMTKQFSDISFGILNGKELTPESEKFLVESVDEAKRLGIYSAHPLSMTTDRIAKIESLTPALEGVMTGDTTIAESPETMATINELWADQIKVGINEPSEDGTKTITDKEIARFDKEPFDTNNDGVIDEGEYRMIATLNVTYSDGTVAERPMTQGRSSDPSAPVQGFDVGQMIESTLAQGTMAAEFKRPEVQKLMSKYQNRGKESYSNVVGKNGTVFSINNLTNKADVVHDPSKGQPKRDQYSYMTQLNAVKKRLSESNLGKIQKNQLSESQIHQEATAELASQGITNGTGAVGGGGGGSEITADQILPLLGDPASKNGKTIRDNNSGMTFLSDGKQWNQVK